MAKETEISVIALEVIDEYVGEHVRSQEELRIVRCPSCLAKLKIETRNDLPPDTKLVYSGLVEDITQEFKTHK